MRGSESFVDKDVAYLKGDCQAIFIGDTHGDPQATLAILKQTQFYEKVKSGEKIKLVFLGDYADRGSGDVENLELILNLKIQYPDNVVLLQGNHEEVETSMRYGLLKTLINKYGKQDGQRLFIQYAELFKDFPNAVITENGVLAMHGGIGNFDTLTDLQGKSKLLHWADPSFSESGISANRDRLLNGGNMTDEEIIAEGFASYGRDALESYLGKIGAQVLIRAHQYPPSVEWDGKMVTVFSNGSGSEYSNYKSVKPIFVDVDLRKDIDRIEQNNVKDVAYSVL